MVKNFSKSIITVFSTITLFLTLASSCTPSATYTVNASVSGGHGTVAPISRIVNYGNCAFINVSPDTDYHIANITDNGVSQTVANPYTIANVTADHHVVVIFAVNAVSPSVTTNPATSITTNSALLNGNLTSMGSASSVNVTFEWGTNTNYGYTTTSILTKTSPETFSLNVTGLSANTTFHFRAKAVGDNISYGLDQQFTTTASRAPITLSSRIAASADDVPAYFNGSTWTFFIEGLNHGEASGGRWDASSQRYVTGMRFKNVNIPKGAIITSATITFTADIGNSQDTVNTKFTGQADDNPGAFTDITDLKARRGTIMGGPDNSHITSAQITWDNLLGWSGGSTYTSPNLSNIVQEIVNRAGWNSGNAMVIFWDDADGRSTGNHSVRSARSFDGNPNIAPLLSITYVTP